MSTRSRKQARRTDRRRAIRQSARSPEIELTQVATNEGTSYVRYPSTLYQVQDGNLHFSTIDPDDF